MAGERADALGYLAVAADGTAVPVGVGPVPPVGARVPYSSGRAAVVVSGALGDPASVTASEVREVGPGTRIDRLAPPPGASEGFDWLQLDAGARPRPGRCSRWVPPSNPAPAGMVQFRTTGRDRGGYLVQVASCPQWTAVTGPMLYLQYDAREAVGVSLHRSVEPLVGPPTDTWCRCVCPLLDLPS